MIADYYVPPKDDTNPSAYYVNVGEASKALEVSFSKKPYLKKINFLTNPTEDDLKNCATAIQEIFADGFQWGDISDVMKLSIQYLNNFLSISLTDKRACVLKIFDYVIENTDTPYLPDYYFDPIFSILAEAFVNVVIPDSVDEIIPYDKITGDFSSELISEFTEELKNDFADGFQWSDVAAITGKSIKFVHQFLDTSKADKKQVAKDIISSVIEHTDIPYVPDFLVDSLLNEIACGFVDNIVDAVDSFSIF